jgi:putative membrane protein
MPGEDDELASNRDPRVYFAAERTLLAWIRTGLTVVGLGFVVARFGLFLRLLARGTPGGSSNSATWIGVSLVLLGSTAMALASWQHFRFSRSLPANARPHSYIASWSVWFAGLLVLAGFALAIYLIRHSGVYTASTGSAPWR